MANSPNDNKRLAALHSANIILNSTCQLFLLTGNNVEAHGCGVLFVANSKYYCLSNSHVLCNIKFPKVYILNNINDPVLLEGNLMFTEKNLDNVDNYDSFDIAIIQLTQEVKDTLLAAEYTFINIDRIETSVDLLRENVTMIAAYPGSQTKFNNKSKSLEAKPLIIRTIPIIKDYSDLGFLKAYHHVIDYPKSSFREGSTGQRMFAPLPHGMSGSGLWILVGESDQNYQPFLIGILSEYHKNKSLIFSTKIDLYLSIVKQLFDKDLPYNGMNVNLTVN